jgi:hypothetical protein
MGSSVSKGSEDTVDIPRNLTPCVDDLLTELQSELVKQAPEDSKISPTKTFTKSNISTIPRKSSFTNLNIPRKSSFTNPRTQSRSTSFISPRPSTTTSPRPQTINSPRTSTPNSPKTSTPNSPKPSTTNSPRTSTTNSPRTSIIIPKNLIITPSIDELLSEIQLELDKQSLTEESTENKSIEDISKESSFETNIMTVHINTSDYQNMKLTPEEIMNKLPNFSDLYTIDILLKTLQESLSKLTKYECIDFWSNPVNSNHLLRKIKNCPSECIKYRMNDLPDEIKIKHIEKLGILIFDNNREEALALLNENPFKISVLLRKDNPKQADFMLDNDINPEVISRYAYSALRKHNWGMACALFSKADQIKQRDNMISQHAPKYIKTLFLNCRY